jgi:hypothetical protein
VNRPGRGPNWAPADDVSLGDEHAAVHQGSRKARFIRLALALDDLLAASACLRLVSQSDASPNPQTRRALVDAMVVAYGRLFSHVEDTARGLPDLYEPAGQLLVAHLQLLGMRNLSRQHGESSSRRVQVGPARGRSADSHVSRDGRVCWSVRPDPLGPLDLQQVDALFQSMATRIEADAAQLCADLFAGRPAPPRDVVLEDA